MYFITNNLHDVDTFCIQEDYNSGNAAECRLGGERGGKKTDCLHYWV